MIILPDFGKAFDMVEHEAVIQIMRHKGFGDKWIGWIQDILTKFWYLLSSLEWSTRENFPLQKARRPTSPLLFVLAAYLLQSVINNAKDLGLLKLLKTTNASSDFPVVQYADDTRLIMEACPTQLTVLKDLLLTLLLSQVA
jgi:hypothetical protein